LRKNFGRDAVTCTFQATFKEIDEAFAASGKDAADKKARFAGGSWVSWGKLIMAVYRS